MRSRSAVCPIHVGRHDEVAALTETAAAVRLGGRAVLIGGDAGVGKSRLAEEATRIAQDAGFLVLSGQCVEGATAAYAAVAQALRRHLRVLDRQALEECFSGLAGLAATILPEVATELRLPPAATSVASEHLDAAVQQLLHHLATETPAFLLLEDLHWARADTLRMVSSLIREVADLPLWFVGTYRTDELTRRHPLTAALSDLARQRSYEELKLLPLGPEDVGTMVSAIFDSPEVAVDVVDAIMQRTGGNPLFVEELCKVIVMERDEAAAGVLSAAALRDIELPWTIREALLGRVRHLDPECAQVLRIAAVAGQQIDPEVLRRAAGIDTAALHHIIVTGLEHQLLVERRDGASLAYAFRHELTREALSAELIGPQLQHVHRKVAEALLEVHADYVDEAAGEIADHLLEAGELERARVLTVLVARQAAGMLALGEAIERYQQALRLVPPSDPQRLGLLVEAAEAALAPDQVAVAASFATEARARARVQDDAVAEARAITVLARQHLWAGDPGALELFREAHALVEGRGDRWELWALNSLARRHAERAETEAARALLDQGETIAATLDEPAELARLFNSRVMICTDVTEKMSFLERALAAAEAGGERAEQVTALTQLAIFSLDRGDLRRARAQLESAAAAAELSSPFFHELNHAIAAWVAVLMGEYDVELSSSDATTGFVYATRSARSSTLCETYLRRGLLADATACAEELLNMGKTSREAHTIVMGLGYLARCRLAQGSDEARALFVQALDEASRFELTSFNWLFTIDFARALIAEDARTELASWVDSVREATTDDAAACVAALRLCEGLLAAAEGRYSEGRGLLSDAVERFRSLPCPAREAEAWLGLADLERRAGRSEESAVAARAAHDIAIRINGAQLIAESTAALRRLGQRVAVASRARSGDQGGLSAREVEIAMLVAQGLSNAEIGRRLFLSEHTVRNHVSNILGKLELRSRVGVARWVTEQGLARGALAGSAEDRRA